MADTVGQGSALGSPPTIDAPRLAAIGRAALARATALADAREAARAEARSRAAEALAGFFARPGDIDGALRTMTALACVTLVAHRCTFLHWLARSGARLYASEAAWAHPVRLPALGGNGSDPIRSNQPSVKTTACLFECPPSTNPITLLRAPEFPTAAHTFVRRIGAAEPLGILSAYRAADHPFTPQDILLLDAIADRVTQALIGNEP